MRLSEALNNAQFDGVRLFLGYGFPCEYRWADGVHFYSFALQHWFLQETEIVSHSQYGSINEI